MPGEFNSKIEDDIRLNTFLSGEQNQQHIVVSVYEESYYRLRVQLDCGGQLDRDVSESPCSRSLSVFAWIDYNDNNVDDREGLQLRRAWSENSTPTGVYEIEIRIPTIDGRDVKSGRHRMRVTVLPSEEFQRECKTVKHIEIRDYTIHIFPKARPISTFQCHKYFLSFLSLMRIQYLLYFSRYNNTIQKSNVLAEFSKDYSRSYGR